jgi:hypothetical protein
MILLSVLGRQASHLLLIRANLGYGTVLTAACARQGCNATDYYCYYYYHHQHPPKILILGKILNKNVRNS